MKEIARVRREQKDASKLQDAKKHARLTETRSKEKKRPVPPEEEHRRKPLLPSGSQQLTPPASVASSQGISQQIEYHLDDFPSKIAPHTHKLLNVFFTRFASAMFPIEYNLTYNPVLSAAHLEFSMTDDAVFHGILFGAAVSAELIEGRTESNDIAFQMNTTIHIVNQRLKEPRTSTSDGVIGAVTCLAIGEVRHTREMKRVNMFS